MDAIPTRTPTSVKARFSVMMFLQYAIWGAWLPLLYPFLMGYRGFSINECGICLSAGAVGAIFGPFLAGQLADRVISTERLLAISHLVGAVLVLMLGLVETFLPFALLSLVYGFVYAPTLALTNSISLTHVADRDRDFGPIRVWGTVGWIAAGILMGQYLLRASTPDLATPAPGVTTFDIATDPVKGWGDAVAANPALGGIGIDPSGIELRLANAADAMVPDVWDLKAGFQTNVSAVFEALRGRGEDVTLEGVQTDLLASLGTAIRGASQDAGRRFAFTLSAVLGLALSIFCLTLPHTPPTQSKEKPLAWAEAIGEIRFQPLLTLFLVAIPVSMVHQFYFVYTADFLSDIQNAAGSANADLLANGINQVLGVGGTGLMTIGQMSEILVLALIPFFGKVVGRKWLLLVGLAAYAARMAIFAYAPSLMPVLFGVALHGLCFGCFIFVAYMVVDEHTTPDVRATAQNLFNLVIIGIGIIVGSYFATGVVGVWAEIPAADGGGMDFARLFSVPMWMAIGCAALLLVAYPSRVKARVADPA